MKTHRAQIGFGAADQSLPSVIDLIDGRGLFGGDLGADAAHFAHVATRRIRAEVSFGQPLLYALRQLTRDPGANDFLIAAREFEAAACRAGTPPETNPDATRCYLYAAIAGDQRAANRVAGYALASLYARDLPISDIRTRAVGAVAWLLVASGQRPLPSTWTRKTATDFMRNIDNGSGPGKLMVDRMLQSRQRLLGGDDAILADPVQQEPSREARGHSQAGSDTSFLPEEAAHDSATVVVLGRVGNEDTGGGERVAAEFEALIGQRIPLAPLPDTSAIRQRLLLEFPHGRNVIESILRRLYSLPSGNLTPVLLVGPTGSGKTSFAIRLSELLRVPFELVDCGGISDAALAGTPRRWEMGGPSLPVALIRTHHIANPVIILDDLDKLGTSRTNGALQDALAGLVEPKTAARWRDPYLEAPADLSHIRWLFTANSLQGVPKALQDRCAVLRLPCPGEEHLASLARNLIRVLCAERGLHEDWAMPLDGIELSSLTSVWKGGSLRKLRRFVDVLLSARELEAVRH